MKFKGEVIKNKRISDFCIPRQAAPVLNNPVFPLLDTLDTSPYSLEDPQGLGSRLESEQSDALSYFARVAFLFGVIRHLFVKSPSFPSL